ncbi:hypothetical protein K443DRAFT_9173 [Laccaria amethystina LaAM-08-1]|uniref:O-methyltransferase n=1 Tax=Laccaria amethystina LaAM-08-1 TaxID=1095629 RepID=A0A0C9XAI7_9AGAR|nr:hypothetical protein K443DRAFT_9173 [Laccaria amethystina LaAM-08-1]
MLSGFLYSKSAAIIVHTRISISHPNESHTPGLPAHHPRQTLDDWERSDKYHNAFLLLPDPALEAAAKRNDEQGLPDVAVSPAQGKFLNLLAQSIVAKKILEYSSIWMAKALLHDGTLVTLEISEKHAQIAKENIAAAGLTNKISVILGPAIDSLRTLRPNPEPFDLVFIDADKQSNTGYFVEAKRLVRKGGIIIFDNAVQSGRVADPNYSDERAEGVRDLLLALKDDKDVEATTIGTAWEKGYYGFLSAVRK